MFHIYGISRSDADYILETFSVLKRRDVASHGEYRTKRLILGAYDRMAKAISTSTTYGSPFDKEDR
jgi:hypothetical protein